MTYLILSVLFVGIAMIALAVALARRADRRDLVRRWLTPALAAGAAVTVLTAVFDNLMILAGLMVYSQDTTSGLLIGLAPLEDFAYPLAGLLLLPALWLLTRPKVTAPRTDQVQK